MTVLSDRDWDLVSGYADGELPPEQAAALESRLPREPALADALARVREAKVGLARLAPSAIPAEPGGSTGARITAAVTAFAAIAAAVLIALVYSQSGTEDWRNVPAEMHAALSSKTYVLPERSNLPVISTAHIGDVHAFDLSSSRLFLVDIQSSERADRDVVAMHYRGLHGCRLTVVAMEALAGDPTILPARSDGLGARWTVKHIHFYMLASGMDPTRFQAIAGYAEAESRLPHPPDSLRKAMKTTTDNAKPCV